jgi:pterin-4a-carbinolamine dehydratase
MNWKQENNQLIKDFQFENQEKLARFFIQVAKFSDGKDHHADALIFNCSTLRFVIFTHSTKSITQSDYQLADKIDGIYIEFINELK